MQTTSPATTSTPAPVVTTEPDHNPLHDTPLWKAHDAAMLHLQEVAARRDYSVAGEAAFSEAVATVRKTFHALIEGGA